MFISVNQENRAGFKVKIVRERINQVYEVELIGLHLRVIEFKSQIIQYNQSLNIINSFLLKELLNKFCPLLFFKLLCIRTLIQLFNRIKFKACNYNNKVLSLWPQTIWISNFIEQFRYFFLIGPKITIISIQPDGSNQIVNFPPG
ncbi:unnamed protein product [Paramecium pentaurelia]|uniref:Uncharacterized protein n=1 Tax=Paramecium pentaurelia TaxID=43138 RepID=A0A8S1VU27_9CILI|nr:unnamed protein product [Paramecium pentaurelia]